VFISLSLSSTLCLATLNPCKVMFSNTRLCFYPYKRGNLYNVFLEREPYYKTMPTVNSITIIYLYPYIYI
jgi:hypothetical protein